MKRVLLSLFIIVTVVCLTTSCDNSKDRKSSENALAELIEDAAEKKAAKLEKKRKAKAREEAEEKARRAELEEAEEEARMAREEAAAARQEAAAAREEARRARAEANTVRVPPRPRANIAGARRAHVIREGGYTNARSGPGTGYSIMNKVKDGSPILYTGNLGYAWVEVYTLDGRYLGYMSSNKVIPEQ